MLNQASPPPQPKPKGLLLRQTANTRNTLPDPADLLGHALPLSFKEIELELFHFYTNTSAHEILGPHMTGSSVWQTSIITLSFEFPFLVYGLLSLSSLHLHFLHSTPSASTTPSPSTKYDLESKYYQAAMRYHHLCLRAFRAELQRGVTYHNAAACVASASLLGLLPWLSPDSHGSDLFFPSTTSAGVPWYKLHRGGHEVVKSAYDWILLGVLSEMVTPWGQLSFQTPHPPSPRMAAIRPRLQDRDLAHLDALAGSWSSSDLPSEDMTALNQTLTTLHYIFTLTSSSLTPLVSSNETQITTPTNQISAGIATLSWTILFPSHFCTLVEERMPQALILLTAYCVLLKRIEGFWWARGKAESLLGAVIVALPSHGWEEYIAWPIAEVLGSVSSQAKACIL